MNATVPRLLPAAVMIVTGALTTLALLRRRRRTPARQAMVYVPHASDPLANYPLSPDPVPHEDQNHAPALPLPGAPPEEREANIHPGQSPEVFPFGWNGENRCLMDLLGEVAVQQAVGALLGSTGDASDHDLLAGCLIEAGLQGQRLQHALEQENHSELRLRRLLNDHQKQFREEDKNGHTSVNPWTRWAQGDEHGAVTQLLSVLGWSAPQTRRARRILERQRWH